MTRKEWKITGIFLGMIVVTVTLLALTMDENILDRLERRSGTIAELQEKRKSVFPNLIVIDRGQVRRQIREKGYSPQQVEDFRAEMEERGFSVQDGKIVRRSR